MFDNIEGLLFAMLVVLLIGFGVYAVREESKEYDKNMAECMKDHKEYECHAMLDDHNQMYPVIIPMNVGR